MNAVEKNTTSACSIGVPVHDIDASRRRKVPPSGFAAAQDDIEDGLCCALCG